MAKEITVDTAHQYLLQHVGALRKQLPFGDPFVFVNAFTILNVLANASGGKYELERFIKANFPCAYKDKAARLIQDSRDRLFYNFSLQPEHMVDIAQDTCEQSRYFVTLVNANGMPSEASPTKLNLSHKDREHFKVKDGKLTLSASAFLDDLEEATNKFFKAVKADPLLSSKVYVYFNEGNQLIGLSPDAYH